MSRLLIICILAIMPGFAMAERVALVIGNAEYESVVPLDNPVNDSEAVTASLEKQGFTVFRRDNLSRSAFYEAIREFRVEADNADYAIVYYAGHGIEVAGTNFLVPVDARLEDERDAHVEMISVDVVLRQLSGAKSLKMFVLDACRNNPFVAKMKRSEAGRNVGVGLANVEATQADTLIAYAAAAGEITPDGDPGKNSPFTRAFVDAVAGPPSDVRRLLGKVRDKMRKSVPGAAPFVYSSLGGDEYVINPNSKRPEPKVIAPVVVEKPKPVLPAASVATIMADYLSADRAAEIDEWDVFLQRYAKLNYHQLYARALEQREQLQERFAQRALSAEAPKPVTPALPAPLVAAPPAIVPDTTRPSGLVLVEPGGAKPLGDVAPASESEIFAATLTTNREAAREIQRRLKARKCYRGGIDGILGRGSNAGLASLSKVTGQELAIERRADLETLRAMVVTLMGLPDAECPVVARAKKRTTPRPSTTIRRQPAPVVVAPAPAPQPKPKPKANTLTCRQC